MTIEEMRKMLTENKSYSALLRRKADGFLLAVSETNSLANKCYDVDYGASEITFLEYRKTLTGKTNYKRPPRELYEVVRIVNMETMEVVWSNIKGALQIRG